MAPGNLLKFAAVSFVLPFTLNFYAYYGFISNYSSGAFSRSTFLAQFETGIYKYRILGNHLLLFINDILEAYGLQHRNSEPLKFLDSQASAHFYDSYFILNTAFLCLTCAVLYLTYSHKAFEMTTREKHLWIVVLLSYMVLSQFVVVPYDTLSYFILCSGIYFILSARHSPFSTLALLVLVVLGTLTRESIVLLLSFYATVHFLRFGFKGRKNLLELLLLTVAFLSTYLSLRFIYGFDDFMHQGLRFHDSMGLGGVISILFFLATLITLVLDLEKAKTALVFLLFSFPYIAMILLVGALFEIRLWIPLIIPIAILASLNPRAVQRQRAEPCNSESN